MAHSAHRRAVETRRLYRFEDVFTPELPYYARRTRSLPFLRAMAAEVWSNYGRKGLPVPTVRFGTGIAHQEVWYSYAHGYGLIELAPPQRTVAVLLHELAHTMGYGNPHGRGFVRKMLELLVEYGRCDEGELRLAMTLFRVQH